jgi:hypothetical protein
MTLILKRWGRMFLMGALLATAPMAQAQDLGGEMLTLDQEFSRIAEEVPGFGGLYLDEAGTTHIYLVDLSRALDVQDLGERVEVHQGQYDFRDLVAWKEQVRDQLSQRGAVSLDIDERRNRLVFGVERTSVEEFSTALRTFLRNTRVPAAAVVVEAAEPIVQREFLNDRIRPVPGGVQIESSKGGCTLGVNAVRLGVRGFVTNSHCTITRGNVDGTVFFQNVLSWWQPSLNRVGIETADPAYTMSGSCPSGRLCRLSDSAFVAYDAGTLSGGGQIANPRICPTYGGTPEVDPDQPRLPVTGYLFGTPSAGSVVRKVGSISGCSKGYVTNTCADVNAYSNGKDTGFTHLCQVLVSAGNLSGDSGGPVFQFHGDHVTLVGILWGGSPSSYAFSPWLAVHGELAGVTPELQ